MKNSQVRNFFVSALNSQEAAVTQLPLTYLSEDERVMQETGNCHLILQILNYTYEVWNKKLIQIILSKFGYGFSVSRVAKEQILPHVRTMENEKKINDSVLKALFENGVSV